MRNERLVLQSFGRATENRAKHCQLSGHLSAYEAIASQYQKAHPTRFISRHLCVLVFFLGIPAVLCAQKEKGTWSDLNRLKAGQGIEVIESSLKQHEGQFLVVTDELLSLREHGSDVSVKRGDIVRVSTSSAARRGEHAAIGLVIGGAIGAGIGALAGSKTGFLGGSSRGITTLVGIALGAPSGALVGALVPGHTTVYRTTPTTSHQTTGQ